MQLTNCSSTDPNYPRQHDGSVLLADFFSRCIEVLRPSCTKPDKSHGIQRVGFETVIRMYYDLIELRQSLDVSNICLL